jgi:hypothetical protein
MKGLVIVAHPATSQIVLERHVDFEIVAVFENFYAEIDHIRALSGQSHSHLN